MDLFKEERRMEDILFKLFLVLKFGSVGKGAE